MFASEDIEKLMVEKSKLISEAETLMALKRDSEAKQLYIKAARMELQIADKSPRHRFIQLVSAFWCAFKGGDITLSTKICEMINKLDGLNQAQEQEINKIKKAIGW